MLRPSGAEGNDGAAAWPNTAEGMQACRDIGSHAIMPMHLTIRCPRPCGAHAQDYFKWDITSPGCPARLGVQQPLRPNGAHPPCFE